MQRCLACLAVYATANISGGHVNPAVTWATCLSGHMDWPRGGLYMAAQLLGAIFGALIEVGFWLSRLCISEWRMRVAVAWLGAVRPAAQREGGRRHRAWLLHTPQGHPNDDGAAVVVGGHHDLPAGGGEAPTDCALCHLLIPR